MNIHITLIAYALDIAPLVHALNGSDVTWHIFTHSQKEACIEAYNQFAPCDNVRFHNYGVNRGLSVSWNDGVIESQAEGADAILVLNDDIEMSRADMLTMVEALVSHRDYGVVVTEGYDLHWQAHKQLQFVAFGLNPVALDTVGYFDQNCAPYCFEDSDYSRRCALSGIRFWNTGPTGIRHLGSQAVKRTPELACQNQVTFAATRAYYARKWGGEPGSETFSLPFNDTAFGYQIAASQRHDPYPGHLRSDLQELVKV